MQNVYKNLAGNSPIRSYEFGEDFIDVEFKERSKSGFRNYHYSYASTGADHIEKMKLFADGGRGLCTYIVQNVKKRFERQW